jgi:uncharacterized membrane protein YeiH
VHTGHLVSVVDLLATFVFAVQGGLAAGLAGLDAFGVLVVAFVTAVGGGVVRDVLIGAVPPATFRSSVYPLVVLGGGAAVVLLFGAVREVPPSVLVPLDAAGLALFAVVGAAKAVDHDLRPLLAVLLGAVSAVGGGVIRDLLLQQVPLVLRSEIYAVAALTGAGAAVIGLRAGLPRAVALGLGALACFALRLVAVRNGWNLPRLA